MNFENLRIGFLGGGNMAHAIVEGLLKKDLVKSSQIIVSSPSESTVQKWKDRNIHAVQSNVEVIKNADIIFLSFKPYQLKAALPIVKPRCPSLPSKLFISILAGVSCETVYKEIQGTIQEKPRVVKVMPNTPAMVCEGCSAIALHESATVTDAETVTTIFSALGKCEIVSENLILPITGLAGCGPAFIYMIIEALSDGAVKQGLNRELATTFAAQTVLGAAKMILESKKHPGQLKDDVCSAGGTTISGLHALEKGGLRATLMNAIEASVQRAEQIGAASQKQE